MALKDIRKALEEGRAIIGTERVIKGLKRGEIKEVYLASNCPSDVVDEIKYLAKLCDCKVSRVKKNNEELGIFCRKPYFIAVIGVKKEGKAARRSK